MTTLELLDLLTRQLKDYREVAVQSITLNHHLNQIQKGEEPTKKQVDGVLVDFINYIGAMYGVDYALSVEDLQPINQDEKENQIPSFLAVDEDGLEYIFNCKPIRMRTAFGIWSGRSTNFSKVNLPTGTIEKITGRKILWNDEPIKIQ